MGRVGVAFLERRLSLLILFIIFDTASKMVCFPYKNHNHLNNCVYCQNVKEATMPNNAFWKLYRTTEKRLFKIIMMIFWGVQDDNHGKDHL
jgi:hypothetical protein